MAASAAETRGAVRDDAPARGCRRRHRRPRGQAAGRSFSGEPPAADSGIALMPEVARAPMRRANHSGEGRAARESRRSATGIFKLAERPCGSEAKERDREDEAEGAKREDSVRRPKRRRGAAAPRRGRSEQEVSVDQRRGQAADPDSGHGQRDWQDHEGKWGRAATSNSASRASAPAAPRRRQSCSSTTTCPSPPRPATRRRGSGARRRPGRRSRPSRRRAGRGPARSPRRASGGIVWW